MNFNPLEGIETPAENPGEIENKAEPKLNSFQNPIWTDMLSGDLTPKIRFTTDKAEAEEAAKADRSNPFDLPDAVFYVGDSPSEQPQESGESSDRPALRSGSFQNEVYDVGQILPQGDRTPSGEYAGPSPDSINLKIQGDIRALTLAQDRLDSALKSGTGVMAAMHGVEQAQAVLDARMKLYNEAIAFRAPDAAQTALETAAQTRAEEPMLGSVSHAEWKLQKAIESGSSSAIAAAKRELAREIAAEEAKRMKS